jgi:hypothetical protein
VSAKRPLLGAVSELGKPLFTIWTHHCGRAETTASIRPKKKTQFQGLGRADDGTRTHDLLHGKPVRAAVETHRDQSGRIPSEVLSSGTVSDRQGESWRVTIYSPVDGLNPLGDLGLASPGTVDSPRGLARRVSLGGIDGVTPSVSAYAPAQRRPRTNEDRERGRAPRAGELVDRRDASLYDWDRAVDVQGANRAVE